MPAELDTQEQEIDSQDLTDNSDAQTVEPSTEDNSNTVETKEPEQNNDDNKTDTNTGFTDLDTANKSYQELQKKLGEQGLELGDLRKKSDELTELKEKQSKFLQKLGFNSLEEYENKQRELQYDEDVSKFEANRYLDYINDPDKLKEFKSEVKKRITDLANKNYQNAGDLSQPDFVLMYMPVETSVNLLYEDSDLINTAYKSNIIIVGTSSLLATIRLVNQLFAQQKQKESINQIVSAGTNLYETFVQFCEDLTDVQKRFEGVSTQLNKTINRFKRGNKNKPSLFSQVEALKEFGISSQKQIPAEYAEEIEEVEEQELEGVLAND